MKLTGLTPNVFSSDLDRSIAFYRDVLGFTITTTVPDARPFVFAWLQRDGVSIFLNDLAAAKHEEPDAPFVVGQSGISIFIHLEGIGELWPLVKDKAPVVMALKDQWYGMTEFSVADPDGYVITLAERKAE